MRRKPWTMVKKAYYAVRDGRQRGIFNNWDEAKSSIQGYSNATYKKFSSKEEATRFMEAPSSQNESSVDFYRRYNSSTSSRLVRGSSVKPGRSSIPTRTLTPRASAALQTSKVQDVYTDGSSRGNGRSGAVAGYGIYYGADDFRNVALPLAGSVQTNQRAELTAIKGALETAYKEAQESKESITKHRILTDSQYSIKAMTEWSNKWEKNNWTSSSGTPVSNQDIIKPALETMRKLNKIYGEAGLGDVEFVHVRGHTGNAGNELADTLANRGAEMNRRS